MQINRVSMPWFSGVVTRTFSYLQQHGPFLPTTPPPRPSGVLYSFCIFRPGQFLLHVIGASLFSFFGVLLALLPCHFFFLCLVPYILAKPTGVPRLVPVRDRPPIATNTISHVAPTMSMSVHSLIDKFSEPGDPPPVPKARSGSPVRERHDVRHATALPKKDAHTLPSFSMHAPPRQPLQNHPFLAALLGPEAANFPFEEATLIEALKLRQEQERTRQELVRADIAAKNLAIVQMAVLRDVPPHMIPQMCVGNVPVPFQSPQQEQKLRFDPRHPSGTPSLDYLNPPNPEVVFHAPSPGQRRTSQELESGLEQPLNFRFGGSSRPAPGSLAPHQSRRPLLPAKIGAAAVATLANPVTPLRPVHRTLPLHQRHFLMPADPTRERIPDRVHERAPEPSPERTDRAERAERRRKPLTAQLQLPLGATSAIQVRPHQAQPLSRQSRNNIVPLQELMSSFQHIIQFHHWKPEAPGDQTPSMLAQYLQPPPPQPPLHLHLLQSLRSSVLLLSLQPSGVLHKRHKSNDMLVDLLALPALGGDQAPPETPGRHRKQPSMADVSMDTSDVTLTEDK